MTQSNRSSIVALAILVCPVLAPSLAQAQVSATLVLEEGDIPAGTGGSAVTSLDNPFTNGLGEVGFVGRLANGDHFLWIDNGVAWRGSNAAGRTLTVPSPFEVQHMGFSDTGGFVYMPRIDGAGDGLWTQTGLLLEEGDPAPDHVMGETVTFLYRPIMLPDGAIYFVASADANGDTATDERALYVSPDGTLANTVVVLRSGDTVSGEVLDTFGVDLDYGVSASGNHYIVVVDLATGSNADDGGVVLDGVLIAQEGVTPTGDGTLLDTFDVVAVNDLGNHLISGRSNSASATDDFLLYNGALAIVEGDTVSGMELVAPARVQALSINNSNQAVHLWTHGGGEALFFANDASSLVTSSQLLLAVGDAVDLNSDGVADATVVDLNAQFDNGSGLNLADNGMIFVNVDLDYDGDGLGEKVAILGLTVGSCGDGVINGPEACDDAGESATCDADCTPVACGDGVTNGSAGEDCDTVGVETPDCDLDCTLATCGDGVTNGSAGEDCDDAGESADCDADCTPVECGDGTVNSAASEDCDEFGVESATCDADCTEVSCGDDTVNLAAGEVCDDAGESATCDADCTLAVCGDGTGNASAGEECDEGDASATCDPDCSAAVCGDGWLNSNAGEECEDGNATSGDGCSATCQLEGPGGTEDPGGCGCRLDAREDGSSTALLVLLCALALLVMRRRSYVQPARYRSRSAPRGYYVQFPASGDHKGTP